MLLTEKIHNTTMTIALRRKAIDNKAKAESYFNALTKLNQTVKDIEDTLSCAIEMKKKGIISTPIISEEVKNDLLSCIDTCGNGLSPDSEEQLSIETVRLLQAKGKEIATAMKVIWKSAADEYAKGCTGYLSMIAKLTDNPKQSKELVERINNTTAGDPSIKAISKLVEDVATANQITENFSISPEIESFLKKVSAQQATVVDLTSDVIAWLNEKHLMGKLKVRF